ncbi:MAG: Type 1 glutamine amidotransferase-like domain-containing protein [Chloroflexota bacterium]
MNGAIALVGSGEYLPGMVEVEAALLDDAVGRGKARTYVQLPTAAGREGGKSLEYWRALGASQGERIGVATTFLPVLTRADADDAALAAQIEGAGLVYLSGGDPRYLAQTLVGTRVGRAIESHWRSGGALAGCSAGAMVMGDAVTSFRLTGGEPTPALNLLPGLRVIPHYRRLFGWAFGAPPAGAVLLGIEEMTALVRLSGGTEWRVMGAGAVHVLQGAPQGQYEPGEVVPIS